MGDDSSIKQAFIVTIHVYMYIDNDTDWKLRKILKKFTFTTSHGNTMGQHGTHHEFIHVDKQ